mmetsp:Transcript_4494/g.13301  ORF Transcript_4494/g.13301 Transcript_4494/m.13301 type:complete len:92 (-) Transcript_4494:1869-2144(-)
MAERKAEVAATVSVDCAGWDGGHEEGTSEVRKKEEEHLWRVLGEIATRGKCLRNARGLRLRTLFGALTPVLSHFLSSQASFGIRGRRSGHW